MSKKLFYRILLCLAISIVSIETISSLEPDSHPHELKIKKDAFFTHRVLVQKINLAEAKISATSKSFKEQYPIVASLILPWSDGSKSDTQILVQSHNSRAAGSSGNNINGKSQYGASYQTFTSGINLVDNGSSFVCPANLPYVVNHVLTYSRSDVADGVAESPTIYARGYMNSCGFSDVTRSDLLYGSDQHSDFNGKASNLSAFVPNTIPNGCNTGVAAAQPVIVKISAQTVESPIYAQVNNKIQIVGYQQTTTPQVDCNKICNAMLDNYCNADSSMGYCGEIIVNSYYVKGTYNLRKRPEHFCSCGVEDLAYPGQPFTNAVDVESAVKYNNPIKSITCSNMPQN